MTDAGAADPRLAAALQAHQDAPSAASMAEVLAALPAARLFAAITAAATSEHIDDGTGLRAESAAEMALVTLVLDDQRALPVFTSATALGRWRLDVRPVPVPGAAVCAAALEQGATTLLIDLVVAVSGSDLEALARGYVPVVGSSLSSRRTTEALVAPAAPPPLALLMAIARALATEPIREARLLDGPTGPVLGVVPEHPLDPAELAGLARRLVVRLGRDLPAAGLDLAVVPPGGPGTELPQLPRRWTRSLLRRGR